jgi:formate dehydrogenase subunit delta
MTGGKMQRLVRMANQIADNFSAMSEGEATSGAADHLQRYWTPKMVSEIIVHADSGESGLNLAAATAVAELKRRHLV